MTPSAPYAVRRESHSEFLNLRGLRYHVRQWGDATLVTPDRPPLVLLHGWMDVGASFQFAVDELAALEGPDRWVIAPDWRGFGLTESPFADSYWFPDYLGDLDALLDILLATAPAHQQVDLLGHSMGGNVVMLYAGARPARIRRLVNLEGFGQPASRPEEAPARYTRWLDELKEPADLVGYPDATGVARRLGKNNPLLPADRAAWLAEHWARPDAAGRWRILGDPAHKRVNPYLYRKDEALACWAAIEAPLLWVEGDQTDIGRWWGDRYSKAEFHDRLKVVRRVSTHVLSPAGHMLHHDQPRALAERLKAFLDG
jgi:pimeloyl-ACP methyl ester carboxylesterase